MTKAEIRQPSMDSASFIRMFHRSQGDILKKAFTNELFSIVLLREKLLLILLNMISENVK